MPRRYTRRNPSRPRSDTKPGRSDAETLATFVATTLESGAAGPRSHTRTESVLALSLAHFGLVGAFHDEVKPRDGVAVPTQVTNGQFLCQSCAGHSPTSRNMRLRRETLISPLSTRFGRNRYCGERRSRRSYPLCHNRFGIVDEREVGVDKRRFVVLAPAAERFLHSPRRTALMTSPEHEPLSERGLRTRWGSESSTCCGHMCG